MEDQSESDRSIVLQALLASTRAETRQSAHELECTRRYQELSVSTSRFHSRLDQILTLWEDWKKDDFERRERRDRDTKQTTNAAKLAAASGVVAVGVAIIEHFWK